MKRVIALGFFDGVHIGHQTLFQTVCTRAEEHAAVAAALTFDLHPMSFVHDRQVPLLCDKEDRERLIRDVCHISDVIYIQFTSETMRMSWQDFIHGVLLNQVDAAHVVVGHDFTFGYKGEGTATRLRDACRILGVGCDIIQPVSIEGMRVSSTLIRGLVSEGEMERAAQFLGHPYEISGTVLPGKGLGRTLGFPTLNLPLLPHRQWPAFGVYRTEVVTKTERLPALTNIGLRPTVESAITPVVETTIPGWSGDLYGQHVTIAFKQFVRSERKFATEEELCAQVNRDIEAFYRVLNSQCVG